MQVISLRICEHEHGNVCCTFQKKGNLSTNEYLGTNLRVQYDTLYIRYLPYLYHHSKIPNY